MKEIALYVLMAFNANGHGGSWTFGPVVTLKQCEAMKAHIYKTKREASWSLNGIGYPTDMQCLEIPSYKE